MISSLLTFLDSVVFWVFLDLLPRFLSSFCHPFGGRDGIKKQKILQEIIVG